jgi:hypothetical protein
MPLNSDLIRGVVFGGSGLIRGVVFGGSGHIRGVVFGGSGLWWEWFYKRGTSVQLYFLFNFSLAISCSICRARIMLNATFNNI